MAIHSIRDAFINLALTNTYSQIEAQKALIVLEDALASNGKHIRDVGKVYAEQLEEEIEANKQTARRSFGNDIQYWEKNEKFYNLNNEDLTLIKNVSYYWIYTQHLSLRQSKYVRDIYQKIGIMLPWKSYIGKWPYKEDTRSLSVWIKGIRFPDPMLEGIGVLAPLIMESDFFDQDEQTFMDWVTNRCRDIGYPAPRKGSDLWQAVAGRGDPGLRIVIADLLDRNVDEIWPYCSAGDESTKFRRKNDLRRQKLYRFVKSESVIKSDSTRS